MLFTISSQPYPLAFISVGLIVQVGPPEPSHYLSIFLRVQVAVTHPGLWVYHTHAVSITDNGMSD